MCSRTLCAVFVLASIVLVSGCSGGGGHHDKETNFQGFVQNLATTPVDDADPVAIDGLDFTFTEDPHAFDALFQ